MTQAQQIMAEPEVDPAHKPWITVRIRGWQPGAGSVPGRMLFNVVAGEPSMVGSTVTIESLLKHGWRVEVIA